jgi:predicted nucleic acid-binding protein
MSNHWILNASPLIVLARIRQAGLFAALAEKVVLPQAVANEILAGPEHDPAYQLVRQGDFEIVNAPPASETLLAWDLGAGETSVLALAIAEPGWTAILDDAAARRCARSFQFL